MQEQEIHELAGRLFRHESGKMAAVLTRLLGMNSMELADDLVQDTILQAMSVWRYKGIPENPSAWLYTVAKRKAIDTLRKQKVRIEHHSALAKSLSSEWTLSSTVHQMFSEHEIEDSQLRMIFACCHPSIPYDAQLALTLKTLCGLSIHEIAKSFLTNEETISKRIYRAREKIREEKISLDAPPPSHLPERMDAVLHSLYLLFNEGYNSSHAEHLIRHDLCEEAIRLCILLTQNALTNFPNTQALLSLMCFQASRSEARVHEEDGIILLKDQDRSKWIRPLIEKGKYYLEKAADGEHLSEYHLEAAIAACHANATSFEETDWNIIIKLYDALSTIRPSDIVEMNRAVAKGYGQSPEEGLKALKEIENLNDHYLYHAAMGDFYSVLNDHGNAIRSYTNALALTSSPLEKNLLDRKISLLNQPLIRQD